MSRFTKADRQRVIDGYLGQSGRNTFDPHEFIDWLGDNPEHEAYPWFYGTDDATAAREHRVAMARQFANGLRIRASVSQAPGKSSTVHVVEREYPAYISPVASRKGGGGYIPFDPHDPAMMDEHRRQGVTALEAWLRRYRGAFEMEGADMRPIEKLIAKHKAALTEAA